ncbi:MAG: PLDc N-terminal domain-containing protein [Acidimicrobiia bacterium]
MELHSLLAAPSSVDTTGAGAAVGIGIGFLVLYFAVIVAAIVLFIWALIDCLRYPDQAWEAVGQQKIVWILVIVLVGCIGPLLYFFIPRPKLKAWKESGGSAGYGGGYPPQGGGYPPQPPYPQQPYQQ